MVYDMVGKPITLDVNIIRNFAYVSPRLDEFMWAWLLYLGLVSLGTFFQFQYTREVVGPNNSTSNSAKVNVDEQ